MVMRIDDPVSRGSQTVRYTLLIARIVPFAQHRQLSNAKDR
jgi:hypothetical protein